MSAQKNDTEDMEASEETVKPSEYVRDLLKEKLSLSPEQHGNAMRLLDQEVAKAQAQTGGKPYKPEHRYVDIYKDKPIKLVTKVLVPVKEHPKFNFVGKLLGPKGNSLKRLQEETMCKMAILGRGSMRDKSKEEEFRNALDPKYSHLNDELHVEIQVLASPAEAYARVAYALAEIRKYLVPDVNDEIRQEQLREIQQYSGNTRGGRGGVGGPVGRGGPVSGRGGSVGRGGPLRPPVMAPRAAVPPMSAPVPTRPLPGKTKVMSILDRARAALEEPYGPGGGYDDGYFETPASMGYTTGGYGSGYNGSGYYESGYEASNYDDSYGDNYGDTYGDSSGKGGGETESGGVAGWKNYSSTLKMENPGGGKMPSSRGARARGVRGGFGGQQRPPYSRPLKQQY